MGAGLFGDTLLETRSRPYVPVPCQSRLVRNDKTPRTVCMMFAGVCRLQDQGPASAGGLFGISASGTGWAQPGLVSRDGVLAKGPGYLTPRCTRTPLAFFHPGVLFRAQNQPPVTKPTPRLPPPWVERLSQRAPELPGSRF